MSAAVFVVIGAIFVILGVLIFSAWSSDCGMCYLFSCMLIVVGCMFLVKGGYRWGEGHAFDLKDKSVYTVTMIDPNYEWIRATLTVDTEGKSLFYNLSEQCAADLKATPGKMYSRLTVRDDGQCIWENIIPAVVPITLTPLK